MNMNHLKINTSGTREIAKHILTSKHSFSGINLIEEVSSEEYADSLKMIEIKKIITCTATICQSNGTNLSKTIFYLNNGVKKTI